MKGRILIVDDNREAADALARLIGICGYETRTIYDGQQAVEAAADFNPDMALIDIGMPGLNGYEVAKQIRQQRANVHVIVVAVTGYAQPDDKRRAYESGFDLHVAKPMNVDKLNELLALLDPSHDHNDPA